MKKHMQNNHVGHVKNLKEKKKEVVLKGWQHTEIGKKFIDDADKMLDWWSEEEDDESEETQEENASDDENIIKPHKATKKRRIEDFTDDEEEIKDLRQADTSIILKLN